MLRNGFSSRPPRWRFGVGRRSNHAISSRETYSCSAMKARKKTAVASPKVWFHFLFSLILRKIDLKKKQRPCLSESFAIQNFGLSWSGNVISIKTFGRPSSLSSCCCSGFTHRRGRPRPRLVVFGIRVFLAAEIDPIRSELCCLQEVYLGVVSVKCWKWAVMKQSSLPWLSVPRLLASQA